MLESRAIWLSSLSLSNDSMEGKLVADIISEMARNDGLNAFDQQQLRDHLARFDQFFDGFGFCLSEEGDLLSQWRGYADDA